MDNLLVFQGKINAEVLLERIESIENHFECEGITEAQKVKVVKSKLRGQALTWQKFVQEERKTEVKKPIAN